MAILTDQQITAGVNEVANEVTPGGNTKTRIATLFRNIYDTLKAYVESLILQSNTKILSGLAISLPSSTSISVASGSYLWQGVIKTASTTSFTIAAAASGLQRFEVLYLEADNIIKKLAGTDAVNPAKPTLPTGAMEIGFVLVNDTGTTSTGGTTLTSTDQLPEGSNAERRYYSQARENAKENAIAAGTSAEYIAGDKTKKSFFSSVRETTMSALNYIDSAIGISDTLEVILGKLQGQINWIKNIGLKTFKFPINYNTVDDSFYFIIDQDCRIDSIVAANPASGQEVATITYALNDTTITPVFPYTLPAHNRLTMKVTLSSGKRIASLTINGQLL